jgi:MOSC domain-containing protein YiiM
VSGSGPADPAQTSAHLLAVNVVHDLVPDTRGDMDRTGIDKRPRAGRVAVHPLGVDGDVQYDRRHHGGRDQAVYAYAREDALRWAAELGYEVTPGRFGENLTTVGLEVTAAVIGERWAVGEDGAVLEVSCPRIPCRTFQGWMDEPHWVRRFTEFGAPGAYLRVVEEGTVGAGDPVRVLDRPAHGVTVGEVFRVRGTDAARLERLLEQPDLAPDLVHAVRRDLAARAR